jgi:predicted RNase H-like HicB family nuclease
MENIREAIELYLEPVEDDRIVEEGALVRELVL